MRDLIKLIGTQAEVAEALGVSPRTVQWWASGKRSPTVAMFLRLLGLAKVTRVDIDGDSVWCYGPRGSAVDGLLVGFDLGGNDA